MYYFLAFKNTTQTRFLQFFLELHFSFVFLIEQKRLSYNTFWLCFSPTNPPRSFPPAYIPNFMLIIYFLSLI